MSIRTRNVHFKDWAAVCKAYELSYTSDELENMTTGHAALIEDNNKFYYHVAYVKSAGRIYTHGKMYDCASTNNSGVIDEIEGLQELINTKQDKLTSGTNIATINYANLLNGGNITTPDTKVTSADNHYAPETSSTKKGFITEMQYDSKGHITGVTTVDKILDNDIVDVSASKIKGTIGLENLPAGALERMFVVSSETAAMSADVQDGDVVQVTGNDNKMYFCVDYTATTFATRFKEFTAGIATSVPWSGVTDKPDLATQDELNVVNAKFENYLPLSSFTKATIKTTLGISDWALASSKPTYTASQVGALGKNQTAAAATKLATPRTIWGQSFDGTRNVDGDFTLNGGTMSYNSTNGWTLSDKVYSTDFITTSDNRLKDFTTDVDIDFGALKNIPKKYYYWKDKTMGDDLQIGTSAQELMKVYPECVHYDESLDRYSVNYQKLSIVALAAIDKLHDRVVELEKKLHD